MKFKKPNKKWKIVWFILALIFVLAAFPVPPQKPIKYVDRESGRIQIENVYGEKWLDWLYHNPVGEATLWTIAKRKIVTSLYGDAMEKPTSADKIMPFVKEYDVDLSISQSQTFRSFNDFFIRKLKPEARPIVADSLAVASPADGKILAYENVNNSDFYIKGFRFKVDSFLDNKELAEK